jgi:hypothetical protein
LLRLQTWNDARCSTRWNTACSSLDITHGSDEVAALDERQITAAELHTPSTLESPDGHTLQAGVQPVDQQVHVIADLEADERIVDGPDRFDVDLDSEVLARGELVFRGAVPVRDVQPTTTTSRVPRSSLSAVPRTPRPPAGAADGSAAP